jgi:hypothetical protein
MGTNPVRVTRGRLIYSVCWDPDGKHLVYDSGYPTSDIHRIAVDGTNDVNITYATGAKGDPDCR